MDMFLIQRFLYRDFIILFIGLVLYQKNICNFSFSKNVLL